MVSLKEQLNSGEKQINSKRIENFLKLLKAQSKVLIECGNLGKNEFRKHQMNIESFLDVSPTSTTDLSSKLSSINVVELMGKINDEAEQMLKCAQVIERRVALHNALFPDDKEESLTDDELDFLTEISIFKK